MSANQLTEMMNDMDPEMLAFIMNTAQRLADDSLNGGPNPMDRKDELIQEIMKNPTLAKKAAAAGEKIQANADAKVVDELEKISADFE